MTRKQVISELVEAEVEYIRTQPTGEWLRAILTNNYKDVSNRNIQEEYNDNLNDHRPMDIIVIN